MSMRRNFGNGLPSVRMPLLRHSRQPDLQKRTSSDSRFAGQCLSNCKKMNGSCDSTSMSITHMHFEFDPQGHKVFKTMIVKRFDYFLHIATPGGQTVSISRDDHASCVRQAQIWLSGLHEISLYEAWFANLSNAIRRAGNCHVPVRRVGNGSTERSCKLALTVCWSLRSGGHEWEREYGQHTLTLPKSLICTDEAGLVWFPTWALKKSLMERRRVLKRGGWEVSFLQTKWLDQNLVKEALRAQLVELVRSRANS